MSSKKVVIDIRMFCLDKGIKIKTVCEDNGVSGVSLLNWRNEAPDVVKVIYLAMQESKGVDILNILKGWQKPPHVLTFIRDFMVKYDAKFEEIIYEN